MTKAIRGCLSCKSGGDYDSLDYYCDGGEHCMNKDDDYDFGFSLVDETEIIADNAKPALLLATKADDKLKAVMGLIMPMLNNLAKNPEKTHIQWPNRAEKITQFKKKLEDIINS